MAAHMKFDAAYEQVVERNAELEAEKEALLEELEAERKDNKYLRREVSAWRGA